ncbi:N-acetylmuramoyl-L-alanine amidase [Deinococcus hopiensis KR-140]|uniref:N-acetylmuramoyl-L-alanine amidase n=2 Tax=Deinococcus TaxID=1298 RepID=A0A1W1VJ68_9DEIO|nr:N-acetylmuramoyl-L-alanine amidase [Deinococcus hopiensis]SMB93417.1 N-acetylmuramoyl-L-alanine amidase [Deinococcus hopiensis KR-140]
MPPRFARRAVLTIAALATATLSASVLTAARAAPEIFIAYPPEGHRVTSDHVLLEGSVTAGAALKIGGRAVAVGSDGLFILWWPLRVGVNDLRLTATAGAESGTRTLRVTRGDLAPLPARPTAIDRSSVTPNVSSEFWDAAHDSPAERTVRVSFRGAPGGRAFFQVGQSVPQSMREVSPGSYEAAFALSPALPLDRAAVTLRLTGNDGRTVLATAPGRLSNAPLGARTGTQRPGTVQGLGLNASTTEANTQTGTPFLYPRDGMTFALVGRQGNDVRARLAPGVGVLISEAQLDVSPGLPVQGQAGAVTLEEDPASPSLRIRVPLGEARVPFTLSQEDGGRRLSVTLYGLETPPGLPTPFPDPLLGDVQVEQVGPGVSRVTLNFTTPQAWGFTANYGGDGLLLTVRRPPVLDPARPLAGRMIVLDPGHGGTQLGGAGALRVPEKDLTLPIARRVAELLRAQGAGVQLTRESDVTLGLYERGLSAEQSGADLLVSIHANALPDGRDPRGIRGPEVYFTHPQAQAPAAAILAALRRTLPDLGPGAGLKPGADLALTRPSTQPSLLIETAYLTDPGNLRVLMNPAGRERLAGAIAAGIADFFQAQASGR